MNTKNQTPKEDCKLVGICGTCGKGSTLSPKEIEALLLALERD